MRVPPNNADAEKSVLGCMMQDREALSLAFELLTADDFYQPDACAQYAGHAH